MAEIVLVHGAWHGPWCWEHVAVALTEHGHVVHAVTLPGHDAPGTTKRIWNRIGQYVDTVAEAVRGASDPPVLVGHSMGGYVVQRFLETGSAACGVLVASVPRKGTLRPNLRALRQHPAAALRAAVLADYSHFVSSDELVHDLFFTPDTPDVVVADCRALLQNESILAIGTMAVRRVKPDRISSPMVVIGAAGDAVFTSGEQHDLAAAYGGHAEMLDGGHDLMLDTNWRALADSLDRVAQQHAI